MSFRSRLLLFFMIIVIVPMVAVALVLFSITADSETGKADAAIAEGMRSAFAIYNADRVAARPALRTVASDPAVASALAARDSARVSARITALKTSFPSITGVAVFTPDRKPVAATGSLAAVAPAVAAPSIRGRRVGYVAVSTTTAQQYVHEVQRVTGLQVRLLSGIGLAASTLPEQGTVQPRSGNVRIAGSQWRGRFAALDDPVGRPARVGVFESRSHIDNSISDRRAVIAATLAGCLVLAPLSSIVVVRALQRQIEKFLEAARRLAHGDFSRPVPVEGGDEFAG